MKRKLEREKRRKAKEADAGAGGRDDTAERGSWVS